jgi:hypothetical protein
MALKGPDGQQPVIFTPVRYMFPSLESFERAHLVAWAYLRGDSLPSVPCLWHRPQVGNSEFKPVSARWLEPI